VNNFIVSKKAARLIVLQRIELISSSLKKIRKIFGRFLFSSFITKFFLNEKLIGESYHNIMLNEFSTIEKFINKEDNLFLSIGGGLGGLELIINEKFDNRNYHFIERNFISKKVKYGWGGMTNSEAYNDLNLQKNFLETNGLKNEQINIYDYDKDDLPNIKFDLVISLLSLDYHYDFDIYINYLKKISKPNTKIIFDTIRADHFKSIFKNVEIIKTHDDTVHKSKRIMCSHFYDL
jgi:SAM-dependent methyltransferase|tara:strand:+ start:60 stop:764 length:705 start_codon:yes stop_codon:yes gene_type:complete